MAAGSAAAAAAVAAACARAIERVAVHNRTVQRVSSGCRTPMAPSAHALGNARWKQRHPRLRVAESGSFGFLRDASWKERVSSENASLPHTRRNDRSLAVAAEYGAAEAERPQQVGGSAVAIVDGGNRVPFKVEAVVNSLSALPPRGSISKSMESFKGKVSLQDFALIFKELAQRGEWHVAWRLFKYMQRQNWCRPDEHIYTIMIGIMGRERMLNKCLELFEDMPRHGVPWNVYSYTALINAFGRNGRFDASLDLLARMRRDGVAPNLITYNTVLNACAKGTLPWPQLLQLFAQMRNDRVQPDRVTFNTLIAACASRGLVEEAGSVFRTMVMSGVQPDLLAYSSLVDIFRRGDQLGVVRMLLEEMAIQGPVGAADVAAYTMLIEAYGWMGDYRSAEEVFDEMVQAGREPNVAAFTALLKAFGRNGCYDEVRRTVSQMRASHATPDLATYHALIEVFTAGGFFREAASLFEDMVDGSLELTEESYALLLSACGLGGLAQEATEIYRHLRSQRGPNGIPLVQPTARVYEGLISAYGNAARYMDALGALHDAINHGITAERGPFHALLSAYARAGLHDDAAFVYALMLEEGGEKQGLMGRGYGDDFGEGRGRDERRVWNRGAYLGQQGQRVVLQATNETFNHLIDAFCKAGLYEEALSIRDDMLEARKNPDENTYAAMVSVYCGVGHYEAALAQVLEIKEENVLPPLSSYCDLISLCARRNRWRFVRMFLEEMAGVKRASEYRMVRDLVLDSSYRSDDMWPVVDDFLAKLRVQGMAASSTFYNSVLDVLWTLGLRATAVKLLRAALARNVFPEAVGKSPTLWSLNVHRMSPGAALAALSSWTMDLHEAAQTQPEQLPPLFSIVVRWGDEEPKGSVSEISPVCKALRLGAQTVGLPFHAPQWHKSGRLVCDKASLLPWLQDDITVRLGILDAELSSELTARRRA